LHKLQRNVRGKKVEKQSDRAENKKIKQSGLITEHTTCIHEVEDYNFKSSDI